LRDDSGGAGAWRGGLGTEKVVRAVTPFMFNAQVERVQCRPWGLFGGLSGAGNQVSIQCGNEPELRFPSGKVLARQLQSGDAYILRSGGGGGYGSPLERDIDKIQYDLDEGYISQDSAKRFYGVLFDANGRINKVKTIEHREHLIASGFLLEDESEELVADTTDKLFTAAPGFFNSRCC